MQTRHTKNTKWPDELAAPIPAEVEQNLAVFWLALARLPFYVARAETLLLHALIGELRHAIVEMMLAANGIRFPKETQNLNLYLGESQRLALEKTLSMPGFDAQSTPNDAGSHSSAEQSRHPTAASPESDLSQALIEALIGQAVALVVIYRWYAPQLAAKYNLHLPTELEEETLVTLQTRIAAWPLTITTD